VPRDAVFGVDPPRTSHLWLRLDRLALAWHRRERTPTRPLFSKGGIKQAGLPRFPPLATGVEAPGRSRGPTTSATPQLAARSRLSRRDPDECGRHLAAEFLTPSCPTS